MGSGVVQKSKMHLEQCALSGSLRIEFISLSTASRSCSILDSRPHVTPTCSHSHLSFSDFPPSCFPYSTLLKAWDDPGPAWKIQGNRPISGFLSSSAKSFLLYEVTYPQVPEIRMWASLERASLVAQR